MYVVITSYTRLSISYTGENIERDMYLKKWLFSPGVAPIIGFVRTNAFIAERK